MQGCCLPLPHRSLAFLPVSESFLNQMQPTVPTQDFETFGLTHAHKDGDILGKTHGAPEVSLGSFLLQCWDLAFIFWLISGAGQHRVAARGKTEMGRAGEQRGCAEIPHQLLSVTPGHPHGEAPTSLCHGGAKTPKESGCGRDRRQSRGWSLNLWAATGLLWFVLEVRGSCVSKQPGNLGQSVGPWLVSPRASHWGAAGPKGEG